MCFLVFPCAASPLAALLALPLAPTASPVEAKNRGRTVTRAFRNVVPIALPSGPALPSPVSAGYYPSDVTVGGLKGTIRDVNVRLHGLTHSSPTQVQVLLVGPSGQTAIVMANVGGASGGAQDATLALDDEAALPLGTLLRSGAYRPTNATGNAIAFAAPAPPVASANAALSVFDGDDPNGTWRLFVQDTFGPATPGAFAGGWELEITTKAKAKKKRR